VVSTNLLALRLVPILCLPLFRLEANLITVREYDQIVLHIQLQVLVTTRIEFDPTVSGSFLIDPPDTGFCLRKTVDRQ